MKKHSGLWCKLLATAYTHPKLVGLSTDAVALWAMGLSYCTAQRTDGFIPKDQVRRLTDMLPRAIPHAIRALLRCRLWEDVDGGYRVHNYLEYNPSRAELQALSEKQSRNIAGRWGKKDDTTGTPVEIPMDIQTKNKTETKTETKPGAAGSLFKPATMTSIDVSDGHAGTPRQADERSNAVVAFMEAWKAKYGLTYVLTKGKDPHLLTQMLAKLGAEEYAAALKTFFASSDAWILEKRHSVVALQSNLNAMRVAAGAAKGQRNVNEHWIEADSAETAGGGAA